MPWGVKTVEKIRLEFIQRVQERHKSIRALCREYGISPTTGYKWLKRHEDGLSVGDQSRRPFHTPNKTPERMETLLLEQRDKHPAWGPRKLRRHLENQGVRGVPAASTIEGILKRNHRIDCKQSLAHKPFRRFERERPNELWQVDFKGDFSLEDGTRCYPLTVLDDHSRFSLCIDAKSNVRRPGVIESFRRLFEEYGLPDAILSDNGSPWGTQNSGYTAVDVWFIQLGIIPMHGRPMHPQTQGKEERFHRTFEEELLRRMRIRNMEHAQKCFETFRKDYNWIRPHDALGLDVPAAHYSPSGRCYFEAKPPLYEEGGILRKVDGAGYIHYAGHGYFLSEAFIGERVRLTYEDNAVVSVEYGSFSIASIDLQEKRFISKRAFPLRKNP
jgi:transposase InsO family protein